MTKGCAELLVIVEGRLFDIGGIVSKGACKLVVVAGRLLGGCG